MFASRCFPSGVATIIGIDPTELIAIENRARNIFKPSPDTKKTVVDQPDRSAVSGPPAEHPKPETDSSLSSVL